MGRAVFQGIIFQHKLLNGVWKFIRNSWTGYDYLFKNNRLLFSRTIDYCFPYCFWHFLWSNNPETGYRNAIFLPNGLWRFLKNGRLSVKLHSSVLPPGISSQAHWPFPTGFPMLSMGCVWIFSRITHYNRSTGAIFLVLSYHGQSQRLLQLSSSQCNQKNFT